MAEFSLTSLNTINKELQTLTLTGVVRVNRKPLGSGAYGQVFAVKHGSENYAAKQIHSILLEAVSIEEKRAVRDSFLKECHQCSTLRHPNIVQFIGVYYPDPHSVLPVMVMELMDTSLRDYVKTPNISMKVKISVLYDISQGLSFLHNRTSPIIHRDLSPNNILLSCDSVAKISDLGVAKVVKAGTKNTKSKLTKAPGTTDFMPPEALADNPTYSIGLDIFSYGGLILHTVNQEWPTPIGQVEYDHKMTAINALSEIERRQKYLDMMTAQAEVLKSLAVRCLENNSAKRPTTANVLEVLKGLKIKQGYEEKGFNWNTIGITTDMSWEPALPYAILLQDRNGFKENKSMFTGSSSFRNRHVLRGTLLVRLSQEEVRELKQHGSIPPFNFKVLGEPAIKAYCNAHVVHQLNHKQKELLLGVETAVDRFNAVDKLEWAEKLAEGSNAYVTIPSLYTVGKGIVRYVGKLPNEAGIKFGVELLEHRYFGSSNGLFKDEQFFYCDRNCAVFVALDRLSRNPAITKAPTSTNIGNGSIGGSGNKNPKNLHNQKSAEQQQKPIPFRVGDRVLAFDDVDGGTVQGTVKWTGGSVGSAGKLIGIETDIPVNNKKFGGHVTGMHHMFTPSGKKGQEFQLFLPFNCILNSKQEGSQRTDNQDMSITTQVAVKFAGSDNITNKIKQQQAAAYEKSKKEANKQKARKELELDDHEIDDTMNADTQKKILEEIMQRKGGGNQQPQSGISSHNTKPSDEAYQVFDDTACVNRQQRQNLSAGSEQHAEYYSKPSQEQNANFYCPSDPLPILRAEEMVSPHSQSQPIQYPNNDRFHGNERRQKEHYCPSAGGTQYTNALETQYSQAAMGINQRHQHPISLVGNRHSSAVYNQPHGNVHQMQGQPPYKGQPPYQEQPPYPGYPMEPQHDQYGQHYQDDNNAYMQASGTNYPQQVPPYQPPIPNQSGNYQTHPAYNAAVQPVNKNPHNLGVESLVQYGKSTGVIKWMNDHTAGLEMDPPFTGGNDGTYNGVRLFDTPPGMGCFVALHYLIPNQQYVHQTGNKPNPFIRLSNIYVPSTATGHFVQAPEELDVIKHTGIKGIQGQQNSCYLDATLYGMFAFSNAFDALFLERKYVDNFQLKVKNTLEQKIVNPLRKVHAVVQDSILALQGELATLLKMIGITSDKKDPGEFLNMLFKHVLNVEPFLHIGRPSGTDKEFFIQLFVVPDENFPMPDTYWLLHKMFKENIITFKEYPQRLLLQAPHHGKRFKAFERVKPTLKLDVSVLCEGYVGPCFICDKPGETICNDCCQPEYLRSDITPYFCAGCSVLWHSHPKRQSHKPFAQSGTPDTHSLELLSVLCIETSHYVCFTRITGSGKDEWVFFDSMAVRTDDEYNLPRVTNCTDEINEWVYGDKDISGLPSEELPELVRRYVGDPYLYIYTEFGGNLYG